MTTASVLIYFGVFRLRDSLQLAHFGQFMFGVKQARGRCFAALVSLTQLVCNRKELLLADVVTAETADVARQQRRPVGPITSTGYPKNNLIMETV